jgi:PAS domain S-box-containing protein
MQDWLTNIKNPFLFVSGLMLLAACVFYTLYRFKSRVARALEKEIKEHKQTAEKLQDSEEKFRILTEKSMAGICMIQHNAIKYANPKFLEMFAYTREEMIDKPCIELVYAPDRPMMEEILAQRMTDTGDTVSCQFRGLTKKYEAIYLECYGTFTLYQGQPALFKTIVDITRRKNEESELIKSRKMESVGILAGGIAHDFNNLLTIIIGNITMLKIKLGKKDPQIYNFLEKVEQASTQAAELAHQFVDFSEEGGLLRKKVTLASLLKNAIDLSPEIRHIPCHISLPPDLDPIYGDERQLRQVITNLLLNAHESSSNENEKITITAENTNLDETNPFSLAKGNYVKISVIDNGKGITPELLEKIFDPYFSTKETVTQKGLGMGLAICYSIIKKHEGHIAVTSQVEKGTTVDVYLPVHN